MGQDSEVPARKTPAMEQSTAQRRIVKSPPELWAEVSSEDVLRRHLAGFGEIRITRTDPETTVAWEGDRASGTVELAPAGWGTKVVLTATPAAELPGTLPPVDPTPPVPAPDPAPPAPPTPPPGPTPVPDPAPPTPAPDPMPPQIQAAPGLDGERTVEILTEVLDDLGDAHHRPYSRD
jgi:hypothetical protein